MTISMATIIYVASCIGILGAAVKILHSAKTALLKPLDDINRKLEAHDKYLKSDKERLENLDNALEELNDALNMLIKSHRTVLRHLEDGNHTGEIKDEIDELDNWLIESRGKYGR